jgi:hypothetical protein
MGSLSLNLNAWQPPQTNSLLYLLVSFEILHGAFVFLGRRARVERAKVFSLAGFRILLPGIEPVLA